MHSRRPCREGAPFWTCRSGILSGASLPWWDPSARPSPQDSYSETRARGVCSKRKTSRSCVASYDKSSAITQYPLAGTLGSERRPHLYGGVRHTEENQWLGGPLEDLGHPGLCTILQTHTHLTYPEQCPLQPWELRPTGSMSVIVSIHLPHSILSSTHSPSVSSLLAKFT